MVPLIPPLDVECRFLGLKTYIRTQSSLRENQIHYSLPIKVIWDYGVIEAGLLFDQVGSRLKEQS